MASSQAQGGGRLVKSQETLGHPTNQETSIQRRLPIMRNISIYCTNKSTEAVKAMRMIILTNKQTKNYTAYVF
jgi:hypothetical protein